MGHGPFTRLVRARLSDGKLDPDALETCVDQEGAESSALAAPDADRVSASMPLARCPGKDGRSSKRTKEIV